MAERGAIPKVSKTRRRALRAVRSLFSPLLPDDYLELIKQRAYGPSPDSARLALRSALSVLQRLLAPFLPYAAEEAWSWWHDDSVHTSPWPAPTGSAVDGGLLDVAGVVIRAIRKAKSDAKLSMKAPVDLVRVFGSQVSSVDAVRADLLAAGNVAAIELAPSDEPLRVDVSLHPAEDVQ